MLVLTRKKGEKLIIGDDVEIVINQLVGNRVSIGITAPRNVRIVRGELLETLVEHQDKEVSHKPDPEVVPS